ncbi:MAG TPA: acetate--CoA ligase family protein [Planctomycetota bacterium]|nr:acetate--CoA ligase family protein [Planctomycetota bacterium]
MSALDAIFRPRAIAVVGASRDRATIGAEIFHNLVRCGFQGTVFPVNPKADAVQSVKCYPSVSAIPDPVDLAVVVVPSRLVEGVVDDCIRKGVRGLIVISAGFKEVGGEGVARERALAEKVRAAGMRMVGPNCMGVLNTDPALAMNATFARPEPLPGSVSFETQSGALGAALLEDAKRLGLGLRMFASVGNKADVSGNDLLEYWRDDPGTAIVLMYTESFGNPRRFTEIAREFTRRKPILCVKAGRSAAGAKAAGSHTGALAGLDVAVDALFEQTGVIRVPTVDELFAQALAFTEQPLPRGGRVAVVTNAGGPGILTTDAIVSNGLEVARFRPETIAALRAILVPEASVENPVDMVAGATVENYRRAVDLVLADPGVDAAIVINIPLLATSVARVVEAIVQGCAPHRKPVFGCFLGTEEESELRRISRAAGDSKGNVTIFSYPETAVRALKAMVTYARLRERPPGKAVRFEVDRARAASVIGAVRETGRKWLVDREVFEVFGAYGVPCVPTRAASSAEEAVAAAEAIGFPVVMKVSDPAIVHKTEAGGVKLDLRTADDVRAAYAGMPARTVSVQRMARGGRETILGMQQDPLFGPLLMFGLGGIFVEVMKDVAFRVLPVTDLDAREMVRSIKGFPILEGVRGAQPADLAAIESAILRLAQLTVDFPEVESFDVNPFLAFEAGAPSFAVDARMKLRGRE